MGNNSFRWLRRWWVMSGAGAFFCCCWGLKLFPHPCSSSLHRILQSLFPSWAAVWLVSAAQVRLLLCHYLLSWPSQGGSIWIWPCSRVTCDNLVYVKDLLDFFLNSLLDVLFISLATEINVFYTKFSVALANNSILILYCTLCILKAL